MPVKQHVQEIGGQEGGWWWGGVCSCHSGCVAQERRVQGLQGEVPLSVWSPQGVDMVVLSVLDGVGVPARALIPYVT